MKSLFYLNILSLGCLTFSSCEHISNCKTEVYSWQPTISRSSQYGKTTIDTLVEGSKRIYSRIDSPVIGMTHIFTEGKDDLFTIYDGTGEDIVGSGVNVHPRIKSKVDFLDLDMDGDIDFVIYGNRFFGRYKDNKFAPVSETVAERDLLSYLSKHNSSEQGSAHQSTTRSGSKSN
jgi:hypothetical protein